MIEILFLRIILVLRYYHSMILRGDQSLYEVILWHRDYFLLTPPIPFASMQMQTIDDEEEHLQGLRQANAFFTYAQRILCTCARTMCIMLYNKANQNNLTNPVNIAG